jgi:ectoine hydroxylase-related dioxygenase (phytanoyl-CoA dioxygenase family)
MTTRESNMVSASQMQDFHEQGFVFLRQLLPPGDVAQARERVERHVRGHQRELFARKADGVSRAGEISFTQHLAERDDELARFVRHPRLIEVAVALLGANLDLYWDQAVYKLPDTPRDFPWHQDNGYTAVEPERYLTLWLALGDVTLESGCLWVLPGSHLGGVLPHLDTPIGKAADPGDALGVPIEAKPGDVLAFSSLLLHKSGPNLSDGERKAYIVQYTPEGALDPLTRALVGRGAVARQGRAVSAALL